MSDLNLLMLIAAACDSVILGLWRWTDGFTLKTLQGRFPFPPLKYCLPGCGSRTTFQEISVTSFGCLYEPSAWSRVLGKLTVAWPGNTLCPFCKPGVSSLSQEPVAGSYRESSESNQVLIFVPLRSALIFSGVIIVTDNRLDSREVGVQVPIWATFFPSRCRDRFWSPLSLLSSWYRGLFPRK
jgi:hypothetical protein